MEIIEYADQCSKLDMLAWVAYPSNMGKSCYVYPQYAFDGTAWKRIKTSAFPNNGSFQAIVTGGTRPSDLEDSYGNLLIAIANTESFNDNPYYKPEDPNSSSLKAAINPSMRKGASELEFISFSEHFASSSLIQIVDVADAPSPETKEERIVHPLRGLVSLQTREILVRFEHLGREVLMGPFEYNRIAHGGIALAALAANDYKVAMFSPEPSMELLRVGDNHGTVVATFVDRDRVQRAFSSARKDDVCDWISDSDLADILVRVINASDEFSQASKSQLRTLKNLVRDSHDDLVGDILVDEGRRARLVDYLTDLNNLLELPGDIVDRFVAEIDNDMLAGAVLDEENYELFRDRLLDSSGIREKIAEEQALLEEQLVQIRVDINAAIEEKDTARAEADAYSERAKRAQEELERIRTEALEEKVAELEKLEQQKKEQEEALRQVNDEYEQAIVDKNKIQEQINHLFDGLNDQVATSGKILESEMLRKVVAAVSGAKLSSEKYASIGKLVRGRDDEDLLSDDDVVDSLYDAVSQVAGRDCSKNDIVNYMICMMQGYITTFAGLPGTGKTSLCNILAGALGLKKDGNEGRFAEICVENGWTSYKDYIGYYNPLSRVYERSNSAVFEAVQYLALTESKGGYSYPFLFLLDEANLSPIEHYWSPFLRACDAFATDGAILPLGGECSWQLPPNVRFLATVNFDHTTESLSPRFLDRSWVIKLDPDFSVLDSDNIEYNRALRDMPAFSYDKLNQVFGWNGGDLSVQYRPIMEELIKICKKHSMPISPRSQVMMARYISTAERLMDLSSKSQQFAPLDYAFSQKVLPLISGPEELVGELVEELSEKCSSLKTTKMQLDRMIALGKDSGFYQYFA